MKYKILIFLMLICIPTVLAITTNEDYNIITIEKCYGDVQIFVRSEVQLETTYNLLGCRRTNFEYWICSCNINSKTPIIFNSATSNEYDIFVQYYIKPETGDILIDDNYKRTHDFNNVKITKEAETLSLPDPDNLGFLIIVVLFIIAVCIIILYFVIKGIFTSEENMIEGKKKEKKYYNDFELYK